jgi:asparagine synthase (glutamine-hydrolysing)
MEHIDVEAINLSLLYKKIREKGIRISLDGGTPDETFGGYRDDALLAMRDCFWSWSKRQRFKDLSSIWKELNLIPNDKNMRMIIFKEITKIKEIKKFIESLKNKKDLFSLIDKNKSIYPQEDDIKNLNYFDSYLYKSFHYITSPFIFHKHDKISMANGVISRAPFTDPNIITYIFSLPSSSKIGCGYTKRILRDSMKNIVPDSVLQRKDKRGFTAPPNWYENNMKDYILDSISSTNFLESNFFDGKKIKNNFENKLIRNRNPSKLVLRYVAINSLVDSFKKIN